MFVVKWPSVACIKPRNMLCVNALLMTNLIWLHLTKSGRTGRYVVVGNLIETIQNIRPSGKKYKLRNAFAFHVSFRARTFVWRKIAACLLPSKTFGTIKQRSKISYVDIWSYPHPPQTFKAK